jgi:hypothetical protein
MRVDPQPRPRDTAIDHFLYAQPHQGIARHVYLVANRCQAPQASYYQPTYRIRAVVPAGIIRRVHQPRIE